MKHTLPGGNGANDLAQLSFISFKLSETTTDPSAATPQQRLTLSSAPYTPLNKNQLINLIRKYTFESSQLYGEVGFENGLTNAANTLPALLSYTTNPQLPSRSLRTWSAGYGPRSRRVRYASMINMASLVPFDSPYCFSRLLKLFKSPKNMQYISSTPQNNLHFHQNPETSIKQKINGFLSLRTERLLFYL